MNNRTEYQQRLLDRNYALELEELQRRRRDGWWLLVGGAALTGAFWAFFVWVATS